MKNLTHNLFHFTSRTELCSNLAKVVAAQLREALLDRDRATLIVSGGGTPLPMFRELRTQDLDWSRVHITLADERWVGEDHSDSNTSLVKRELMQESASAAHFIPLWNDADTLEQGVARTDTLLAGYQEPFDVVILGMGNDGHTASLFPCANAESLDKGLTAADVSVVPMRPTTAPHERISMTLQRLLKSHHLILHTSGVDKRETLERALSGDTVTEMPIRAFLQQQAVPVSLYWAE